MDESRTTVSPDFSDYDSLSKVLAGLRGIELRLIQAGEPTQTAYVESFNGKFRDECLNEHWFRTLTEAREIVARWRLDYNQGRPHSCTVALKTGAGQAEPSRLQTFF